MSGAEWKNINIFISSTFSDMHAERDYLVRYVFPELSEWCEKRKLHLTDIDLRWGVTAEDAMNKRTIGVCLRNIDGSRPFFLCFLGQRRGWLPGAVDVDDTTQREYPDLASIIGKNSVTEIEVMHALLSPLKRYQDGLSAVPDADAHSFVFLREDTYTALLNRAQRLIYTNDELGKTTDVREADRKQQEFRERISKMKNVQVYSCTFDNTLLSPELGGSESAEGQGRLTDFRCGGTPLGDVVLEKLKAAILEEYPERATEFSGFDRGDEQAFFLARTADGYIERKADLDRVDQYLKETGHTALVVTAPSGSGKSILLAHVCLSLMSGGTGRVLYRSCGTGEDTVSLVSLFRGILSEADSPALPDDPETLKQQLPSYFAFLADTPTVLILDAIDQIPNGESLLGWLPAALPEELKLIVSVRSVVLTGEYEAERLQKRGMTLLTLAPFATEQDKRSIIDSYLSTHFKSLDTQEYTELLAKRGADNPLFLKAFLSELRVVGRFEQLREHIRALGDTPKDVFFSIFQRLETERAFEQPDSEKTVALLFSLLAASRHGLAEKELLAVFGAAFPEMEAEKLRQIFLIYLRQMRPFLFQYGGMTDLRFSELRRAALERYREEIAPSHRQIAELFLKNISSLLKGKTAKETYTAEEKRALGEVVYHFTRSGSRKAENLLLQYTFIRAKIGACGVAAVIEDCDEMLGSAENGTHKLSDAAENSIRDLRQALVSAAYVLAKDPEQLASQLSMRLDREYSEKLLEKIKSDEAGFWLETVSRTAVSKDSRVLRSNVADCVGLYQRKDGLLVILSRGDAVLLSVADGSVLRYILSIREPVTASCIKDNTLYIATENGEIIALDISRGVKVAGCRVTDAPIRAMIPDPRLIAASDDGDVTTVNIETGEKQKIGHHGTGATALCANESYVYSGGRDGVIAIYDRHTLSKVGSVRTTYGTVSALYAEENLLYSGGYWETLSFHEPKTGKTMRTIGGKEKAFTESICRVNDKIVHFSGKSARAFAPEGDNISVGGILKNAVKVCAAEDEIFFATATGLLCASDDIHGDAEENSPVEIICRLDRYVLYTHKYGGVVLYDSLAGTTLCTEAMRKESISSACVYGKGFLLGRKAGQLLYMDTAGNIKTVLNYRDSINLDPDLPITCLCTNGRKVAFLRYGQLVACDPSNGETRVLKGFTTPEAMYMREDRLYLVEGNFLNCIDLSSGKRVSMRQLFGRSEMKRLDEKTGKMVNIPLPTYQCLKIVEYQGCLCLLQRAEFDSDRIVAYDPETDSIKWLFYPKSTITDLCARGDQLVLTTEDRKLRFYRKNGQSTVLTSVLTMDEIPSAVEAGENRVFVGMYGGGLFDAEVHKTENTVEKKEKGQPLFSPVAWRENKKSALVPLLLLTMCALSASFAVKGISFGRSGMTADKYWLNNIAMVVLLLLWYGLRIGEAVMTRRYRRCRRWLPAAVLNTGLCFAYMLFSASSWKSPEVLRNRFLIVVCLQYLYVLGELLNIVTSDKLRLSGADRILELYTLLAGVLGFLLMIL